MADLLACFSLSRPTPDSPPALSLDTMTSFLKDVAAGMAFLAKRRVIHRDLAARNCLVSESYNVKVRVRQAVWAVLLFPRCVWLVSCVGAHSSCPFRPLVVVDL